MQDNAISREVFEHFISFITLQGFDTDLLLERAGVKKQLDQLTDEHYVPATVFCQLFRSAVVLFEEQGKPVVWAGGIGSQSFRTLCHCIESADTLKEVLERASELMTLLGDDTPNIAYSQSADYVALSYDLFNAPEHDRIIPVDMREPELFKAIAIYSSLEVWCMFCSWLIGELIEIQRVELSHDYISDTFHEKLLKKLGPCTISYGCESNRIFFPKRFLSYSVVRNSESMSEFIETRPFPLIDISHHGKSLRAQVKAMIGANLTDDNLDLNEVAKRLDLSPSSLRRRLIKEGTCFQKIKNECRKELAMVHLQNDRLSITELSLLLGFKDVASFSRSFRSWAGVSPKAFRVSHQRRSA